MKTLGKFLLTLASLAYPLLWYYGRENGAFFWLAAAMCVLWLIRAAMPQTTANALMLAVFGGSLFAKQTVIERLARLQHPDLPPEGVCHTRRVTQIWCAFFIFNGATAAILAGLQYYDWWAAYTGIVSYVLMGILFAGEWIYRKTILKV